MPLFFFFLSLWICFLFCFVFLSISVKKGFKISHFSLFKGQGWPIKKCPSIWRRATKLNSHVPKTSEFYRCVQSGQNCLFNVFSHFFIYTCNHVTFVCLFVFCLLFCHFKLYILSYLCHFIMMSWRHRNVVLNFFRYFLFFLFTKFNLTRVWRKKKTDKFDTNSKKVRG